MQHCAIVLSAMDISQNSDRLGFFTLYHVCEAIDKTDNSQLQLLSRILSSRLSDLKNVFEKIDFLDSNINGVTEQDNPYRTKLELVAADKRKSSMQKKKLFMLKHKRIIEVQIFDTVKSLCKSIENAEIANQAKIKSLVDGKLQQLSKII